MSIISSQAEHGLRRRSQRGFTLLELMFAAVVLLFGIVALAQLVPASIRLNKANRNDSVALIFAQRELDQMIAQPLAATVFTDAQGFQCSLGNWATPNVVVGSPVVMNSNRPFIDYSAAPVAGYNFNYTDPEDPFRTTYDVRWAVITVASGTNPSAKRFILGARPVGGNAPLRTITLDTMVQK